MNCTQRLQDAITAAKEAGDVAMRYYHGRYAVHNKIDDSPVTEADIAANQAIFSVLESKYTYPILSEESKDNLPRFDEEYIWVVDPIDGTRGFVNKTGYFSVMIGLVYGNRPVLGVVYQPFQDILYFAERGLGAYKQQADNQPVKIHVSSLKKISDATIALTSEKEHQHASKDGKIIHELNLIRFVYATSVGIKVSWIAEGACDLYFNAGQYTCEWDTCAPDIILQEAGGMMTDFEGRILSYNQKETRRLSGVVATNGLIHDGVIRKIQKFF